MDIKNRKATPYILTLIVALIVLTILYFCNIKFVVASLNIIMWDVIITGIVLFVKLCQWATRKNTKKRTLIAVAVTLLFLFASHVTLFGLSFSGGLNYYVEGTEPQTHRTFVVEYNQNFLNKGKAKLYERFGPLILPCDTEEFIGEIMLADTPETYISQDRQNIVVSFFFSNPTFSIPLED